jgi:hypothetical protein
MSYPNVWIPLIFCLLLSNCLCYNTVYISWIFLFILKELIILLDYAAVTFIHTVYWTSHTFLRQLLLLWEPFRVLDSTFFLKVQNCHIRFLCISKCSSPLYCSGHLMIYRTADTGIFVSCIHNPFGNYFSLTAQGFVVANNLNNTCRFVFLAAISSETMQVQYSKCIRFQK